MSFGNSRSEKLITYSYYKYILFDEFLKENVRNEQILWNSKEIRKYPDQSSRLPEHKEKTTQSLFSLPKEKK